MPTQQSKGVTYQVQASGDQKDSMALPVAIKGHNFTDCGQYLEWDSVHSTRWAWVLRFCS